ncbi:MAG: hypothetical protein H6620_08835, partial [Halobacteriovoraceae bacterium]|nr:hypothetical protein [Halobacteriovoraceae bacterium]
MGKVIDFTQRRRENIEQKKRQFERVLFKEVIGCYTAIEEGHKIVPIDMIDISPTGCLLEVPVSSKSDKEL